MAGFARLKTTKQYTHDSGSETRLVQDDGNWSRKRGCSESGYKSLTSSRLPSFLQQTPF